MSRPWNKGLHRSKQTPTYISWRAMVMRCENPNYRYFKDYGGRGITVCDRWLRFEDFLSDMGERPPGLTLDRIDNERSYSKDNCRWGSPSEQTRNRRRPVAPGAPARHDAAAATSGRGQRTTSAGG